MFSHLTNIFTRVYKPPTEAEANNRDDISEIATEVFCIGIGRGSIEPRVVRAYYRTCGNANILRWLSRQGLKCSLAHNWRLVAFTQLCSIYSSFYELERDPAIQGTEMKLIF